MQGTPFDQLIGEDRARALVVARYTLAEKAQSKTNSDYDKWFRMYKNQKVDSNYKGFSDVFVPKAFEKVERGTAIISQAIKKIKVNPQGEEDRDSATLNEKLIDYEDRLLEIPQKRKQWIKSARIHGEAYLKCTWDISKETKEEPFRGISISLPDPKNIFFNPDYVAGERFRWVIHEMNIPYYELAQNKKYNKSKLKLIKDTSALGGQSKLRQPRRVGNEMAFDDTTLMVNIKEYFGPFAELDSGDEKPYHIILANDSVILENTPNILDEILDDPIPIFPLHIYPIPYQAHSMGDIEAIASLLIELNDTRNQRMDTVTLNIDPMKIVLRGAQIDEKDLVAKKGWIVHSNIPGGVSVVPPDMQGVVASINEEKIIQGDIDRTLGIPSFGASTPVSGDITTDTATGVNATLQAQDVISNSILEEVKHCLQKFYRAILAFNQTFIDREFKMNLVSDTGGQAININPQNIKGNVDLDVEVELVGNRLARRAEALQALTVGSKIPGTNMGKLWDDYIRTHDKYNINEYYNPPQPAMPEPPKVSISLRGDLTELQSSQVYKTVPGVNPLFADPLMTEEGRNMIRGNLPEHHKKRTDELNILKGQSDLLNSLNPQNAPNSPNQK